MSPFSASRLCFSLILLLVVVAGCAELSRTPLPEAGYESATVLGRDNLRHWGDKLPPLRWTDVARNNPEKIIDAFPGVARTEHNYLALSGGGSNGAYGAGLLAGWTAAGTRPEFTLVTGISIGALTAPFAFLGAEYDAVLREVYSTLDSSSIFNPSSLFGFSRRDALVDTTPLTAVLEKYVTQELIEQIAAEYRRGRALWIGTTNLDAGRPVIWDIGGIANTNDPGALALIRQVLQASASIPGAFPPVYIKVKGPDGKTYDEMHVDGGTSSQIFLYPHNLDWDLVLNTLEVKGTPKAYLIRNSYLEASYDPLPRRLLPIIDRTVDSLIRTQGIGDTYRIYALAKRDGVDVKVTWIPKDSVSVTPQETFDPDYMSALFDYGYGRGLAQDAWMDVEDVIEVRVR